MEILDCAASKLDNTILLRHDGMDFMVSSKAIRCNYVILGSYIDHVGSIHKVGRNSLYGQHILATLR